MRGFAIAAAFVEQVRNVQGQDALFDALLECCGQMRLAHFALSHHVDFASEAHEAVRLHNYPADWQCWFDERGLGRSDPIHRASHLISIGFAWSSVAELIRLTPEDLCVLETATRFGIGDGFTVPAHIPGEVQASCSFAVPPGERFPQELHLPAQLIGSFAFEAARRLSRPAPTEAPAPIMLTGRQLDCVLWTAKGKTDWETARILGVSRETVTQHLKHARERYGVSTRGMLAVRTLFDGLISFSDVLKTEHTPSSGNIAVPRRRR